MKPRLHLAPLAVLVLLAGCGRDDDSAPRWIRLARGFEPVALENRVMAWEPEDRQAPRPRIEPEANGRGLWLHAVLDEWERDGEGWRTARPRAAALAYADTKRVRLSGGPEDWGELSKVQPPADERNWRRPPRSFYVTDTEIHLALPAGEEPPSGMGFAILLENGGEVNGTRRVTLGRSTADGIPVWANTQEGLSVSFEGPSTLRFATSFRGPREATGVFRILLDDEVLFAHTQINRDELGDWHEVPLPETSGPVRLDFEFGGAPGLGVFVDPTIGPADVGTSGARPWGPRHPHEAGRPDLVLFLADTFRADNLAAYGGPAELTPHLNRLAKSSARFLGARAPAAWTLPSVSSLLTGLFPPQHGAIERKSAISTELVTLAELLSEHGYRTVGLTDGAWVSRSYNMDQGFAWFQETPSQSERSLQRMLERAREALRRDDGRPLFLFVHSYRTHTPFRRGADEDTAEFDAVMARVRASIDAGTSRAEAALAEATDFATLYRTGAAGLDATLGAWLAELEATAWFDHGFLAFTSDHGEAFGEHDEMWHEGRLWDEKLRVPLLVRGPGVAPRDVTHAATLVDVPITLARVAGLRPPGGWPGRPLLALDDERPNLAFGIGSRGPQELTIVDGERKVFAPHDADALAAGEHLRAFDLARDPLETESLSDAPWARELCAEVAPLLRALEAERSASSGAELDAELQRALAELGYGGDDED